MSSEELREFDDLVLAIEDALDGPDLQKLTGILSDLNAPAVIGVIERLNENDRAIVYRLLPKSLSIEVFEGLAPSLQSEIVDALHSKDVADLFPAWTLMTELGCWMNCQPALRSDC